MGDEVIDGSQLEAGMSGGDRGGAGTMVPMAPRHYKCRACGGWKHAARHACGRPCFAGLLAASLAPSASVNAHGFEANSDAREFPLDGSTQQAGGVYGELATAPQAPEEAPTTTVVIAQAEAAEELAGDATGESEERAASTEPESSDWEMDEESFGYVDA